ncbi:MAG: hypothetical protein ACLQMF_11900 [Rectinemataceae bacterium]
MNDSETIWLAFADYYRSTILSRETDPNKLHDLKAGLDKAQVYSEADVEDLVRKFLGNESRESLDPILDGCAARYRDDLDEDGQVAFKGDAKAFVRTYNFLASIIAFGNPAWEKLCIFLNFLIPKLPAPREEDLSKGVLDSIDMESYRVEVQALKPILLPDEDAEIDPAVPRRYPPRSRPTRPTRTPWRETTGRTPASSTTGPSSVSSSRCSRIRPSSSSSSWTTRASANGLPIPFSPKPIATLPGS